MSEKNIKIKFQEAFKWKEFGSARIYLDNNLVEETMNDCTIFINDTKKHHIHIEFTKIMLTTTPIIIEVNKQGIELVCGIKYNAIKEIFKYFVFGGLFLFYFYIIKINNRVITNKEYKIYFLIGVLVFIIFCFDTLLNFLIEKKPKNFLFLKQVDNKNLNNKRILTYNKK